MASSGPVPAPDTRSIKSIGDEKNMWLRVLGTPDYLKGEEQLPDLVGLIFRAAAGQVPGMSHSKRFELLDFAVEGLMALTSRGLGSVVLKEMKKLDVDIELDIENKSRLDPSRGRGRDRGRVVGKGLGNGKPLCPSGLCFLTTWKTKEAMRPFEPAPPGSFDTEPLLSLGDECGNRIPARKQD